jgi:pre-mRNA-processing factor 40
VNRLLEGWIEKTTNDGKKYYCNIKTKKSQWNKPKGDKKKIEEKKEDELPEGWIEKTTNDGKKYYYNAETKKSQWDKPEGDKKKIEEKKEDELPEGWIEKTTNDEMKKTQWINVGNIIKGCLCFDI